ncbi:MAG: HigA family addiction module antidote protein [Alistipes sp.]|nr:HigA family addiction module antidote protein [Alistipes sp.]
MDYPFIPIHPGEILKEELETRGISQKQLSELMGIPYTMFNEILNCKRPLSTEMALMFEAALGINADMLCNMQSQYNMQSARQNATLSDRFKAIRKVCAAAYLL